MLDVLFSKGLMGAIAVVLTIFAFVPYVSSILAGQVRPHIFSWFIWAAGTLVVFFAQLLDGGGKGAWVIGLSGVITLCVALLAWTKSADTSVVKADWLFLILALSALPLWYFTGSGLSAVIILTIVDLLGFGPSVRKAYEWPFEESITFFSVGALRNVFVILALENYSWTTVLFPAAVGIACALFVGLIGVRRTVLRVRG